MSKWSTFLQQQLDVKDWDGATLAKRAGYSRSLITRWMREDVRPDPKTLRATSDALGVSIIEAMLAAEFLTEDEVGVTRVIPDPDLIPDDELVRQLARRLRAADGVVTKSAGSDLPAWGTTDAKTKEQAG